MIELVLEVLGSPVVIEAPDDDWARFIDRLWSPFIAQTAAGDAPRFRIVSKPTLGWVLEADGEAKAAGSNKWFLAGELRYWVVAQAMERASGHTLLHASVVDKDGRGVVLLGESGGGKTTLSLALVAAGWGYHSDDIAVVDPTTLSVTGVPTPAGIRDVSRWPEFRSQWDGVPVNDPSEHFLLPAAHLISAKSSGKLSVDVVAFLAFDPNRAPAAEVLTAAQAAVLCAGYGNRRDLSAVRLYTELCRQARCVRLGYRSSDEARVFLDRILHRS